MLLNLTGFVHLDPMVYPTTLAIRIETDDSPDCGVRSGRHDGFDVPGEMGQVMPRLLLPDDETEGLCGFYDYVIDRPAKRCPKEQIRRYHYVVTGKGQGVYYEFPDVYIVTLNERHDRWSCTVGRPRASGGFELELPDYEPGWFARTGKKPL